MTLPYRWLRAAHKIAPNGALFPDTSYYPVKSHGTVKTVPYKPTEGLRLSIEFIDSLERILRFSPLRRLFKNTSQFV
ncbi:hypothetical protein [uncultured Gemmiger sp.]|uniref:hypothetical protein n=1 Tax=uncultured Gemmiger sp. TaxID=1623490 RepID=UPI0025F8A891|nr:hypothetical protein [uncultured Gemmiger sp.]